MCKEKLKCPCFSPGGDSKLCIKLKTEKKVYDFNLISSIMLKPEYTLLINDENDYVLD